MQREMYNISSIGISREPLYERAQNAEVGR
jgi:hypothetical protein